MNELETISNKKEKTGIINKLFNLSGKLIKNIRNLTLIFYYTTKIIFTKQVLAISAITILYYVIQISQNIYLTSDVFYSIQFYTGIITIALSMGLITSEREKNTLPFFLSSVHYPSQIIFIKLGSVLMWVFILIIFQVYLYFIFVPIFSPWVMVIFSIINMIVIGTTTLIISTFTKNTFITGLISALIFFIHFKLLPQIGPINLFYFYFNESMKTNLPLKPIILNRIIVIIIIIGLYDYLIRRIRKMEI